MSRCDGGCFFLPLCCATAAAKEVDKEVKGTVLVRTTCDALGFVPLPVVNAPPTHRYETHDECKEGHTDRGQHELAFAPDDVVM